MGFIENFIGELIGAAVFIAFLYGCYKVPKMLITKGSKAYKNSLNSIITPIELSAYINGRTEKTDKIARVEGTDLVRFPDSTHPDDEYYLVGMIFQPAMNDHNVTIKGKPAKRGHYVRNTIMFGLIGTAATHDREATPDRHYSYKTEGTGEGQLYLVNKDITRRYQAWFDGNSATANKFEGFITKNEDVCNFHSNNTVKSPSMTN